MIPPQKHGLPLPPPPRTPSMIARILQIGHRHLPAPLGPSAVNVHHVDDIGLGLETNVNELKRVEGTQRVAEAGEDEVEGRLGDALLVGVCGEVVALEEGCGVEWGWGGEDGG